jgi:curli biogenesis system outer membrane secretion channel CsgG
LRRFPTARTALLAAAVALSAACASTPHYTNKRADLSSMRRVAVLPFENVSEERLAAEKVQRIFIAELLEANTFDVVEPGRVVRVLREEKIEAVGAMSPEDVQRIGKTLGAEGLVFGSVLELADQRGAQGGAPSVTIQLKLVETATGTTVWSATRQRNGATFGSRFLGLSPDPSTQVVAAALRDAIHTIGR